MSKLLIKHTDTGVEREVTPYEWSLMKSNAGRGDVRKKYRLIGPAPVGKRAQATTQQMAGTVPTFVPKEIQEAAKEGLAREEAQVATMMSATAPPAETAKERAPEEKEANAPAEIEAATTAPTQAEPQQTTSTPEVVNAEAEKVSNQTDDLTVIEGITAKVQEILQANGLGTFAAIAAAPAPTINQVLVKNNLAPKVALVPKWKAKSIELSKK